MKAIDFEGRAIAAHKRWCNARRYLFNQPSVDSDLVRGLITLYNVHGVMAVYAVRQGRIRRLPQEAAR